MKHVYLVQFSQDGKVSAEDLFTTENVAKRKMAELMIAAEYVESVTWTELYPGYLISQDFVHYGVRCHFEIRQQNVRGMHD